MLRETGFLLLAILGCSLVLPRQTHQAAGCGYEACPATDPTKLNVHIIAHSHDDLGYQKTFDQTYYGGRNDIVNVGVQYILDSVIDALEENEDRKFVYAETAYFWKWWLEQSEARQLLVKTLVNEGRLEFVGGGWSQNDEATTNYFGIIDQMSYGLKKLTDTFGECGRPHVGWQIDTYGHSREMATILAELGYDGLFISRVDYQDRQKRLNENTTEFVWESSPKNLGSSAELFTHLLSNFYTFPTGLCYDIVTCNAQSFVDDKMSPDYNVEIKVQEFMNYVNAHRMYYNTNNLIITMGGDYTYQSAQATFKNIDKLISYTNELQKWYVNVIYSSPTCYLKAVNDAQLTYSTVQDDFFPYASEMLSYWTGFYTSRPTNKYFERMGNNFLQVTKQLAAMTQLGQGETSPLDSLRETMGIMEHHHAITGANKQAVSDDYVRILSDGIEDARVVANTALNSLMALGTDTAEFQHCLLLNISKCDVTEEEQFVVTVYNPLSHKVNSSVRFPVLEGTYLVQEPDVSEVPIQLVSIPEIIYRLPEREGSMSFYELVFMATDLPPLGFKTYHVKRISTDFQPINPTSDTSIGDENLEVILDEATGYVKTIVSKGVEIAMDQKFFYYESLIGNDYMPGNRSSGSYVFHPANDEPTQIGTSARVEVYKGDVVDEIHQTFDTWVRQIVRIYKGQDNVEFDWIVGPIPVEDGIGKEVISRFTTDFGTEGLFYTDSNGREMMERKKDYRPTWDLVNNEPVAGNYYPVTSRIVLKDPDLAQQFAVLTDRAQGGSSLNDGQVELMVHRRILKDDGFGVGEPLNEMAYSSGLVVRGKHYVMTGSNNIGSPSFAAQEREIAQKKLLAPWLFFAKTEFTFSDWSTRFKTQFSGLTEDLPPNVLIHTLEPWGQDSLLLRLEHILETDEDTELSQPATVAFEDIFTSFTVSASQEMTLDGNLPINDVTRLVWNSTSTSTEIPREENVLNPMQISTRIINVVKK